MKKEQVFSSPFGWQTVNNTVGERMIDSSLAHNLIRHEKLKTKTETLRLLLQKYPKFEDDEQYRMLKTIATENIPSEDEFDDDMSDSDENFMYLHQCESAWQQSFKARVNKIKVDNIMRPKPKRKREKSNTKKDKKRTKKTTVVVKPQRNYKKKSVSSTSPKKKLPQLKLTTMKNAFKILTNDNIVSITNNTEIDKNNEAATSTSKLRIIPKLNPKMIKKDLTSLFENINTGAQKRKRKSLLKNSFDLSRSSLSNPIAQSTPLTQKKVKKSQKTSNNPKLEFIEHLANEEDKDNSSATNSELFPLSNIAESMEIVDQDKNTCERILPTVVCNEIVQTKYKLVEKKNNSLESEERTLIDETDDVGSSLENDGLSDTENTFTVNNISSFDSENNVQTLNLDKSIKKRKKKSSKVMSRVRGSKNLNLIDNSESCSSIETERQNSTTLDCKRSDDESVEDDQDEKENTIANLPTEVAKSLKIENKKSSSKKKWKISDFFKPKSKNIDKSTLKKMTQTKIHNTNDDEAQEKKETETKNLKNSPGRKCLEFVKENTSTNNNPSSPPKQSVDNTDSGNESLSEKDDKHECQSNKITDSIIDESNKLNENADKKREETRSSCQEIPGILDLNKLRSKTTQKISQLIDFMDRDTSSDEELGCENHEGSTEEETRVSKLKKLNLITNEDFSSDEEIKEFNIDSANHVQTQESYSKQQDKTKSDNTPPDPSLDTSDDYIYPSQDICTTNHQRSEVKKLEVNVNKDSKSDTESSTGKSKNESSIEENSKYDDQGVSQSNSDHSDFQQKNLIIDDLSQVRLKKNYNCVDVSKLRKNKHKNSIGANSESDNQGVEQSNSDHNNVQQKKSKKVNIIDEERNDIDQESLGEDDNSAERSRVSKLKKLDFMNDESSCDSESLSQAELKSNSKCGDEVKLREKTKSKNKRSIEDNSKDNDQGVSQSNSDDSDCQQKNSTIDEETNDIEQDTIEGDDDSCETIRVSKLKKLDFMNDESSCDSESSSQVKLKSNSKCGDETKLRKKTKKKHKRSITDNDQGVIKSNSDDSDCRQKNSIIADEKNDIDQESRIKDDNSSEITRVAKLKKLNLNINHESSSGSESLTQVKLISNYKCGDETKLRKKTKSKHKRSIKDNDQCVIKSNSDDSDCQQKNSLIDEETNDIEQDTLEGDDDSCETIRVSKLKKLDLMNDESSCDTQSLSQVQLISKLRKKTKTKHKSSIGENSESDNQGVEQSNSDPNNVQQKKSKKVNIIDEKRNHIDQKDDSSNSDTESSSSNMKLKLNSTSVNEIKLHKKNKTKQSKSKQNNSEQVNIIDEEINDIDQESLGEEDDNSSATTRVSRLKELNLTNDKSSSDSESLSQVKLKSKTKSEHKSSRENHLKQVNILAEEINDIDQESLGERDDNSSETTRVAKLKKLNLIRDSDLSSDEEFRAPSPHYVKTQVYNSQVEDSEKPNPLRNYSKQDECDENQIMEEHQRVSKLKRLNLTTNDDSSSDEEREGNNSSLKKLDSIRHSINTIVDELLRSNDDKSSKVVKKEKKKRKLDAETEEAYPKLNENGNKKDSVSQLNNQIETNHMIQNYESLTEEDDLSCDGTRVSKLKRLNLIRDSDLSSDEEIVLNSKVRHKNKMKFKSKMKQLSNSEDNSVSKKGEKFEPTMGILKNHNHQNLGEESNLGKKKRLTFKTISTEDNDLTSDNLDEISKKISPRKKDRMNNLDERPQTLEDLITAQNLSKDKTQPTFLISDISENDEVYTIDVPLQMKMDSLVGEKMILTRDKLQFGKHKYSVNHKFITHSCVFHTGNRRNPHKAVNITPVSLVRIGRKLPESTSMNTSFKTDYKHEKKNLQNSELENNDDLMNFKNKKQDKDLNEGEPMNNPTKRSKKTRKTSNTENKVGFSVAKRRKIATATTSSYI